MALAKLSSLFSDLSGSIGQLTTYASKYGHVIKSKPYHKPNTSSLRSLYYYFLHTANYFYVQMDYRTSLSWRTALSAGGWFSDKRKKPVTDLKQGYVAHQVMRQMVGRTPFYGTLRDIPIVFPTSWEVGYDPVSLLFVSDQVIDTTLFGIVCYFSEPFSRYTNEVAKRKYAFGMQSADSLTWSSILPYHQVFKNQVFDGASIEFDLFIFVKAFPRCQIIKGIAATLYNFGD
jgi:hypothetical protein